MAKTIFITGASSGIGKATVDYFADKGWQVVATMRNPEAAGLSNHRPNLLIVQLDVTDPLSIARAVDAAINKFGKIDVLVNNAGYGMFGPFELADTQQIEQQFNTNVLGLMRVTKAVLPTMRHTGTGCIINVSSVVGRITTPFYSLYCSTKFAVEGFTESLYYELSPFGIKVKLIEPGPIKTAFNEGSKVETGTVQNNEYTEALTRVNNFNNNAFKLADEPIVVAKVIYKAAMSKGNRLRYVAGFQGKLFMAAWRILPLWKMRWMQRFMMGI